MSFGLAFLEESSGCEEPAGLVGLVEKDRSTFELEYKWSVLEVILQLETQGSSPNSVEVGRFSGILTKTFIKRALGPAGTCSGTTN